MPRLSHEEFDEKVLGLAATHEALGQIDFSPSGLTDGEVDDDVLYGRLKYNSLGIELARGVHAALQNLRFDVGNWGRLTHDGEIYIDEADTNKRLEMAGILAMMTAPKDQERFEGLALHLYELLDNVAQGNRVVVTNLDKLGRSDSTQKSGQHKGKIQVTFENGYVGDRVISIWSNRPENIDSESPYDEGAYHQVYFPLLTLNLEELAKGNLAIEYPVEHLVESTTTSGELSE
jgi:hypothetical protein